MKAWFKKWAWWIAIVVVAAIFGGRGQIESEKLSSTVQDVAALTHKNHQLVTSLHQAIVQSCIQNGNAARRAARETLDEEIHDAKHVDPQIIAAFNLPPAKIHELLAANVAKLEKRLGRVHAIHCAYQFHIAPDAHSAGDNTDSSTP